MDAPGAGCGRRQAGVPPFVLFVCGYLSTFGADWPQYRGSSAGNGISRDPLIHQWTGAVTNPVWRVPMPNCLGSLTVTGGRVFTQTVRAIGGVNKELCVALDAATGAELWATPVEDAYYPHGGVGFDDGPRTTPSVSGDAVIVLTTYLKLYRLDARSGAIVWQRDLPALFGNQVISWQNAASPVLEDGLIFLNAGCNAACDNDTLMALSLESGEVVWRSGQEGLTHSTPVLATIHGVRQLIVATWAGLVSVEPSTGTFLWKFRYPFFYTTCIGVSPVVFEDMVYVAGAYVYGMGSVVMQASLTDGAWTTSQLWWTNNPTSHWMTPVVHEGFLYGSFGIHQFDGVNAQLKCVDMRTGEVRWSADGFGRGSTLLVDGLLLSLTERGQLVLSRPDPAGYVELGRFLAIPDHNGATNKCWNSPAISDGRVYVRSTAVAACFDLSWPTLRLDPPLLERSGTLQLTVRTSSGLPIEPGRLAGLEVKATTDPGLSVAAWPRLTNDLILSDGVVRINQVDPGPGGRRFFIVNEPR